jgi:hypothetical protein
MIIASARAACCGVQTTRSELNSPTASQTQRNRPLGNRRGSSHINSSCAHLIQHNHPPMSSIRTSRPHHQAQRRPPHNRSLVKPHQQHASHRGSRDAQRRHRQALERSSQLIILFAFPSAANAAPQQIVSHRTRVQPLRNHAAKNRAVAKRPAFERRSPNTLRSEITSGRSAVSLASFIPTITAV